MANSMNTVYMCSVCGIYFLTENDVEAHNCTGEVETSTSSGSTSSEAQGMFWTRPATLLLIEEYKSRMELVNTGKLRKKCLWKQISKALQEKGYFVSNSQCEGRWKTLLRGLKNTHDHNKKSGNNPKNHAYDKELSFMSQKPNISESYVVSSGSASGNPKPVIASSSTAKVTVNPQNLNENDSDTDSETITKPTSNRGVRNEESVENVPKPKKRRSNEVVEVLRNFIDTQQKRYDDECRRKEQMHKERMEVFGGILDLFKRGPIRKNRTLNC